VTDRAHESPKREPLVSTTTLEINFVSSRNTTSPLKPAKAFFSNGFPGTARTKTICDHESPCLNGGNLRAFTDLCQKMLFNLSNSFKGTCVSRALSDDYNCICNPSFSVKNCQFIISHRNASSLDDELVQREPLVTTTIRTITSVATSPPTKAFFTMRSPETALTKTICDLVNPCQNKGNNKARF